MSSKRIKIQHIQFKYALLKRGVSLGITGLPLPIINIFLRRLVETIAAKQPEIFDRLEGHHQKCFRIDITNFPFVLHLTPDPAKPQLLSLRRRSAPMVQGRIAGTFLTLLGLVDGRYDGDALFFTRDLQIEGDTEAVVCLRNALDNLDRNFADVVADFFGTPGKEFLKISRKVSENVRKK